MFLPVIAKQIKDNFKFVITWKLIIKCQKFCFWILHALPKTKRKGNCLSSGQVVFPENWCNDVSAKYENIVSKDSFV